MGLFSSKKKYYAYAASQSLHEDIPDTLESNILQTTLVGGRNMSDTVLFSINTDGFARAKSQMRYARRDGGYIRGVPESNMTLVSVKQAAVVDALRRSVGAFDSILSWKAGSYRESFFLRAAVQTQFPTHWDETMEFIEVEGIPDPIINDPEFIRYSSAIGDENLREILGEDAFARLPSSGQLDGTYSANWGGLYQLDDLDISQYLTGSYIMVKYYVGDQLFYWSYTVDSGLDPILESSIDEGSEQSEFLPVTILMQDKVWFDSEPDSEVHKSTNKLLKKLATSGDEVKEDFLTQEAEDDASGDSNKSNAEKWDFFIHYAVPVNTKIRGSREYLWYFFQDARNWSTTDSTDYYDYLASSTGDGYSTGQPVSELRITENSVNGYNVAYRWSFIETKDFPGEFIIDDVLADGGTRPLKSNEVTTDIFQRIDPGQDPGDMAEYEAVIEEFFGPGTDIGQYDPGHNQNPENKDDEKYGYHDFMVLTKQNSIDPDNPEVPQGYQRTLVMSLSMEYTINTKDEAHSTGKKGYNYRYAEPKLFGTEEETREFRIAMQWGALKEVPTLHREEAVSDGLTATIFLVEVVKVKWYQTGFFKWMLIIIAIILIALSIFYPPFIAAAAFALSAALGAAALAFYIIYVILLFAVGFLISLGTSLMSEKLRMVVMIAAIVAQMMTGGFQNIGQTFESLKSAPSWGSAASLINATSPIYNMGFSVYSQYEMKKLEDEMREWEMDAKERQQELQDAWDSFGPVSDNIDPMDLSQLYRRAAASETADSYFNRTLNPNPGVMGYNLISEYADIAYMLPQEPGQPNVVDGIMDDFARQRRAV